MATLAFNVQADYDKVRKLSDELARLKEELNAVSQNGTPEAIEAIEKQMAACRNEMKNAVKAAAELGSGMEEAAKQMDFSTVEGQISALTVAIHENEQAISETERQVAGLKTQYEQALSAGDTQAVEGITREVREQMTQWVLLTQQTEEYKTALQGITAGGLDTSLDGVRQRLTEVGLAATAEAEEIDRLKAEYQKLQTQLVMHVQQGTQEHKSILERMQAIDGEVAVRKRLLSELREQDAALEQTVAHMEQENSEVQKVNEKHESLRTQIRLLKEQMADMRANGIDEQSDAYRRLALELGRLQDIQGDIQRQGSILANDEKTFAGITSGLQGMSSGFLAVQGAMMLFGAENQKLQTILLKTHAVMSTVNALQQVSAMLNKDSAFRLVTLANAREWWNKVLEAGRGTQVADTAATQANTVAKQANTAAQTGNATAVGANTAAQTAQTASAVAGTAANIGLAGAFRMVGAAIKSIPVFGWIAAAIGAIVAVTATFIKRANEAKKQAQEFYKALSEEVYKPIGAVRQLANEWEKLGDSLEAKQKFVEQNREKFDQLGIAIRGANDAENLLRNNADAFVQAQLAKAKATVLLQQAMEKTRDLAELQLEIDEMPDTVRTRNGGVTTTYYTEEKNYEKERKKERAKQLDADIKDLWDKVEEYNKQYDETLSNAGLSATEKAVEGSANDIKKQIASLQKDLDNNYKVGTDEYNRRKKQIEDLQSLLNDGNGRSGGTARATDNSEKEAKEREKIQKRLNESLLSLQEQNQQAEIDLMDEGTEKKLAQIEHSYKLQISKVEELAKEMAEANAKAGIAGTNGNGLTQEQQEGVDKATENANAERVKAEQAVYEAEKDAMYKFLREYGTYEQQKLAITEQYAKKIADADNVFERMSLTQERDAQLREVDMKFKDTTNWEEVFGSIDTHTDDYLRRLEDKIRTMMKDPSLTADEAEALGGRLVEIQSLLVERSNKWADYFGVANERQIVAQELALKLAELEERRAEAVEKQLEKEQELDELQRQIEDYVGEMGIEISINDIDNIDALMGKMSGSGNSNTEQTKAVKELVTQYGVLKAQCNSLTNDIKKLDKSIDDTKDEQEQNNKGFKAFRENLKTAASALDNIGGQISEGLSGLSEMVGEDTGLGETFGQLADGVNAGVDAFASFESGDYVGAALSALNMLDSFGNALGIFGESDKNYERDMERLSLTNEALTEAMNNLADVMSSATTGIAEANETYATQIANINEQMANTQQQMIRSGKDYSTGIFGGHHSSNTKVNEKMTQADWDAIYRVTGVRMNDVADFWKLTSEEMYKVRTEASTTYAKIKQYADDGYKDAAQYMDEYTEYWMQLQETTDEFYEKMTNTSFDSLADSFKSAISDMSRTTADFADDFEDLMKNAVIDSMMTGKYNKDLEKWYEDFAKAMESDETLTPQEQQDLKDSYMRIVNDARDELEGLYDTLGWSRTSYSQQGTSGGWETMSEDTGQELNGRFTALQETGVELLTESKEQTEWARNIYEINAQIQSTLVDSYLELQEINDNTANTVTRLIAIEKYIKSVKENTDKL